MVTIDGKIDNMPIEQQGELDKILSASESLGLSVGVMSILGWLGHTLTIDDPAMNTKKLVGGILLSGFVGYMGVKFMLFTGMHAELAAPIAAVIGSSGSKGFEWLLHKVKQSQR